MIKTSCIPALDDRHRSQARATTAHDSGEAFSQTYHSAQLRSVFTHSRAPQHSPCHVPAHSRVSQHSPGLVPTHPVSLSVISPVSFAVSFHPIPSHPHSHPKWILMPLPCRLVPVPTAPAGKYPVSPPRNLTRTPRVAAADGAEIRRWSRAPEVAAAAPPWQRTARLLQPSTFTEVTGSSTTSVAKIRGGGYATWEASRVMTARLRTTIVVVQ